jgi:hypothetical protein
MLKTTAKRIAISVVVLTASVFAGCAGANEEDTPAEAAAAPAAGERALAYMEAKYGDDDFSLYGYGGDAGNGIVYVRPENIPLSENEFVTVIVSANDTGEESVSDNYPGYFHKAETEALISEIMREAFGAEGFVSYKPAAYMPDIGLRDFEDYVSDPASNIIFMAFASLSAKDTNEEEVEAAFGRAAKERGACISGMVYFFAEGSGMSSDDVTGDNIGSLFSKKGIFSKRFFASVGQDGEMLAAEWSELSGAPWN